MKTMDDNNEIIEYILDLSNLPQSSGQDLNYTIDLLTRLTTTYNILVNSADGFNKNSFSKKDDVEDAIDRAKDLGKVIDKIIDILEIEIQVYVDYIRTKCDYINVNFTLDDIIKHELNHHIIKKEVHKKDT